VNQTTLGPEPHGKLADTTAEIEPRLLVDVFALTGV
jgi:hypothetical protein